jgi:ribose transport system substrate-binding protein
MKKMFSLVAAIVILTAVGGASIGLAAEKWVSFSVKNIVNPYHKSCWIGAQKAAAEFKDIKITVTSPTRADNIDEQTRMMEDIILKRPNAIVFIPVDYVALVPVVEKMNQAGIPVFNYGNKMAGGKFEIYVGCNDEQMAYEIAKFAFNSIGDKGKVVILDGVPGSVTAQDRNKGYMRAIKETPGVELLIAQPANYNRLMGMQVMENLLQRFPKIDLVLTSNDEMALGAVEALHAAGRLKETKVTGMDGNADAAQAILDGRLFATADYSGHDQGYIATKAAIKQLNGEKIPKELILPVTIVTKDNAAKWRLSYEERPVPNWDEVVKSAKW